MLKRLCLIVVIAGFALCAGCSSNEVAPSPAAQQSTTASRWENKLVRRPGTGTEDSKVYLVKDGRRHWVVSASWLTAHGYNWPADVNEITPAELEAIPQGDAIQ